MSFLASGASPLRRTSPAAARHGDGCAQRRRDASGGEPGAAGRACRPQHRLLGTGRVAAACMAASCFGAT